MKYHEVKCCVFCVLIETALLLQATPTPVQKPEVKLEFDSPLSLSELGMIIHFVIWVLKGNLNNPWLVHFKQWHSIYRSSMQKTGLGRIPFRVYCQEKTTSTKNFSAKKEENWCSGFRGWRWWDNSRIRYFCWEFEIHCCHSFILWQTL